MNNTIREILPPVNIRYIGKLRHRIIIQYIDEAKTDSQGNPLENWNVLKEVWASIEPVRGREVYDIKMVQLEVTHRIIIRYISGLSTKYRILFGDRIFNIDSIINVNERNIYLELMCIERT